MAEVRVRRMFVILGAILLSSNFAPQMISNWTLIPPASAQSNNSSSQEIKIQKLIKSHEETPKHSSDSGGETSLKEAEPPENSQLTGPTSIGGPDAPASSPKLAPNVGKPAYAPKPNEITRQRDTKFEFPRWVVALMSTTVGLLGGSGLEALRRRRRLIHYRKAIYEELRDIHSAIKTRIPAMEGTFIEHLNNQPITRTPATIDNPIFKKWFGETVLEFTEDERLALTSIYGRLEAVVWQFGVIRENWEINSGDDDTDHNNMRRIVQVTEGAYGNVRELDKMIELLLRDKEKHNIRSPEVEDKLNENRTQINKDLRQLKQDNMPA